MGRSFFYSAGGARVMNRSKTFFAALGLSVIIGLLAACGAPADIPKMAEMQQIGIDAKAGTALDDGLKANSLLVMAMDTSGTYNWTRTSWESSKSLEDTVAFYTNESLAAAGWNAPNLSGCQMGDNGQQICLVGKTADGKTTLALVNVYKDGEKVYVVWIRIEGVTLKSA